MNTSKVVFSILVLVVATLGLLDVIEMKYLF